MADVNYVEMQHTTKVLWCYVDIECIGQWTIQNSLVFSHAFLLQLPLYPFSLLKNHRGGILLYCFIPK